MIRSVAANQSSFHPVTFSEGFNLVLADVTEQSEERDSRNGLGKTTLIEIIHFCLGARATRGVGIVRDELADWSFTVELTLGGNRIVATRSVGDAAYILVSGEPSSWPVTPPRDESSGMYRFTLQDWNRTLGLLAFGFDEAETGVKYRPTFRSLISYFARYRRGAFESPFKTFSGALTWQQQVYNAFLLGLEWRDAASWQVLRDRTEALRKLRKLADVLPNLAESVGELEARLVQVQRRIERAAGELGSFNVHPQYNELVAEADDLTSAIHDLSNQNVVARRKLSLYERQIGEEEAAPADDLLALWNEAGAVLGDSVRRRLEEVEAFHAQVVENRRAYLESAMDATRRESAERDEEIARLSMRRAHVLEVLHTHRALDEFTLLQERVAGLRREEADLLARLQRARDVAEGEAAVEIERQTLLQTARRDYDERAAEWREAIALFADNTEALYGEAGRLVIDLTSSGFQFDVDVERGDSRGISHMMVFGYDLMLAEKWAPKTTQPGFLIHDSEIFDGVDERQVAAALRLAARESSTRGFQYICALNSDSLPDASLLGDLPRSPVLRLTDESDEGRLLGLAF